MILLETDSRDLVEPIRVRSHVKILTVLTRGRGSIATPLVRRQQIRLVSQGRYTERSIISDGRFAGVTFLSRDKDNTTR